MLLARLQEEKSCLIKVIWCWRFAGLQVRYHFWWPIRSRLGDYQSNVIFTFAGAPHLILFLSPGWEFLIDSANKWYWKAVTSEWLLSDQNRKRSGLRTHQKFCRSIKYSIQLLWSSWAPREGLVHRSWKFDNKPLHQLTILTLHSNVDTTAKLTWCHSWGWLKALTWLLIGSQLSTTNLSHTFFWPQPNISNSTTWLTRKSSKPFRTLSRPGRILPFPPSRKSLISNQIKNIIM